MVQVFNPLHVAIARLLHAGFSCDWVFTVCTYHLIPEFHDSFCLRLQEAPAFLFPAAHLLLPPLTK